MNTHENCHKLRSPFFKFLFVSILRTLKQFLAKKPIELPLTFDLALGERKFIDDIKCFCTLYRRSPGSNKNTARHLCGFYITNNSIVSRLESRKGSKDPCRINTNKNLINWFSS